MADGAEFMAQLRLEIENEVEILEVLRKIAEKGGKEVDKKITAGLDNAIKSAKRLNSTLNLKNAEKNAEVIKASMAQIAGNGARFAANMQKAGIGADNALNPGRIRQAEHELRRVNDRLSQTAKGWQKNSLHATNVLRVIQDAPFGMLGMGNNIQVLGESFARLREEGHSFGEIAKRMFVPLVAGPMAISSIITLITVLATKWDVIVEKWEKAKELLSGLTQEQKNLNQAIRDFNKIENFQKWVDSLDAKQLDTVTKGLREMVDEQQRVVQEDFGVGDPEKRLRQIKALQTAARVAAGTAVGAVPFAQEKAAIEELMRLRGELEATTIAKRKKMEEDARRTQFGLVTEQQEKADEQAREAAEKRAELDKKIREGNFDMEQDAIKLMHQMEEENLKDLAEQNKEFEKGKLADAQHRIQREKELIRERIQEEQRLVRQMLQDAAFGSAMLRFRGAGTEARDGASMGEQIAAARAKQEVDRSALLNEQMATLEAARITSDAQARKQLLQSAEIMGQQMIEIEHRTDEEITAIYKKGFDTRARLATSMTQGVGAIFGDLATIMGEQTEKGFEQHKGMLKAQAFASAIAASIEIYRNVASAPLGPGAAVMAGIAAAGVLTSLNAQIRKIDSVGANGASFDAPTGSFTALNSSVTQRRAVEFQQQQVRLDATQTADNQSATVKAINDMADKVRDQKVVMDEPTAAQAARVGNNRNTRRVQMA